MTNLNLPFPRSYWIAPRALLAGCYPGDLSSDAMERKLDGLLDAGIRAVVNLMEADEVGHDGRSFVPYEPALESLAARRDCAIRCVRLPIVDMSIPSPERMVEILDVIDESIAQGNPVYVHCWGGRGRTGTVAGCFLARHGRAAGDAALREVARLRRNEATAHLSSPQTEEQREFVRSWKAGA